MSNFENKPGRGAAFKNKENLITRDRSKILTARIAGFRCGSPRQNRD
jgi:hypothetical protein